METNLIQSDALQIAPGIFTRQDNAETFLESLDCQPETLEQMVAFWEESKEPFTLDNIDPVIWNCYGPILDHLNFKRRVMRGDEDALAVAVALMNSSAQARHANRPDFAAASR